MRYSILAVTIALAMTASLAAQNLPINPTTTLAAETGNNTSAADSFVAQTNGNAGAGNVSKLDIHSLLYPGATTKVIAHFMPWWGDPKHIKVGYSSHDPAQIHRQIADMISRGVDGTIIDWYGPKDFTDQTAKLVMAEVEQHPGFTFAIMVDKGAIANSPCTGCNPQQTLVSLVQYVEQTYISSPSYMRVNGQPLITNFDMDLTYTVDWAAVKAASSTNPDFIFQHKGGFTHVVSGGSYSWVIVNVTDEGMDYLSQFYGAGMASPGKETIGAAYKGFNDTLASWGENRITSQQCGQTWLQTFNKINSLYNSTNQLDAVQLVTWNDYEEGTELETGIDNCVSLSASLSGSVLNWQITGNENTIDHYVVYISADGNNLMPLDDLSPGSNSLDLCSYSLASGNYSAYVQAVGKPTMRNQMSGRTQYTAQCAALGSGGSGAGGAGGGSGGSGTATLGATPSSLALQWGESGTSQITVNGSLQDTLSLSCTNLPVGVTCSFSPASIPAGSSSATSNLTIASRSASAVLGQPAQNGMLYAFFFPTFGVAGLVISGGLFTRKKLWKLLMLLSLLISIGVFTSCGGGTITPSAKAVAATTSQSYAITLNGSYGIKTITIPFTVTMR
jgi:Glycosyl hydrolase family 71